MTGRGPAGSELRYVIRNPGAMRKRIPLRWRMPVPGGGGWRTSRMTGGEGTGM